MNDSTVIKVSALIQHIQQLFGTDPTLSAVRVRGELSNFKKATSGHCYFTLKDSGGAIACVMFRRESHFLSFNPADGDEVILRGRVSLYEERGQLQLYVKTMEPAGTGFLHLRFEALKKKLLAEGLCDAQQKKEIPNHPRRVGVVTAGTSAAFRDILNVAARRSPDIPILLVSVRVQGKEGPKEIAQAIKKLQTVKDVDVIILGRGGGSFEDLYNFNEEIVARAIAESAIPIVSAVGHETDFTIADMVADLRAPTPSAAAELVFPDGLSLQVKLQACHKNLNRIMEKYFTTTSQRLTQGSRLFDSPWFLQKIEEKCLSLDRLGGGLPGRLLSLLEMKSYRLAQCRPDRLGQVLVQRVKMQQLQVDRQQTKLQTLIDRQLKEGQEELSRFAVALKHLHHGAVLKRGFAVVRKEKTQDILRDSSTVTLGEKLTIELHKGSVNTEVLRVERPKTDEC
jgi:exodeoxyribonuclease VII large subunit